MIADHIWCRFFCLATQSLALKLIAVYISSANLISNCTVSTSISKKGRHVAGPSHLSDSIGVPRSLQICRQVVKLDAHSSKSGLPEIINIVEETFYSPHPASHSPLNPITHCSKIRGSCQNRIQMEVLLLCGMADVLARQLPPPTLPE